MALYKAVFESFMEKNNHIKNVSDRFVEVRQLNLFCCWECRTSVTGLL